MRTPLTRRDFLKTAGVTGLALGATGGLGGVLAACGGSSDDTSGGGSGDGRAIKVGFVSPLTGPLAAFGETDQWLVEQWNKAVADGVKCGDGQTHPIEIIIKDSQSDSNRAATVAGDLVTNDGVDIMMVASTPDTVSPVADQAEALQVPCVSNDCPWQPYFFGRGGDPAVGFTWTYHAFWGLEDVTAVFTGMWDQLKTNKKVGVMWPNDADGLGWADPKTGQPPMLKAGRLHRGRRRPLPGRHRGLHAADQQVQGRRLRHPQRRLHPAGLRELLEAVVPAGVPAHGRHRRQGAALPG